MQPSKTTNASNDIALRLTTHLVSSHALTGAFFTDLGVTADRFVMMEYDEGSDQFQVGVLTGGMDVRTKQELLVPHRSDSFVASLCQIGATPDRIGAIQFIEVTPDMARIDGKKLGRLIEALAAIRNPKTGEIADNVFATIPRTEDGPVPLAQLAYHPTSGTIIVLFEPGKTGLPAVRLPDRQGQAGIASVRDIPTWNALIGRRIDPDGICRGFAFRPFTDVFLDWTCVRDARGWIDCAVDIPNGQTIGPTVRFKAQADGAITTFVTLFEPRTKQYFERPIRFARQDNGRVTATWTGRPMLSQSIRMPVMGHDNLWASLTPKIRSSRITYYNRPVDF